MSVIHLVGNLTNDPRWFGGKKKTDRGRAVFSIAINERIGEDEERTHFVNATAWGTLGENLVNSLSKGDRVVALGRLNTYTSTVFDEDGDEVNRTETSFTITAIGPDLRWAEAEVTKVKPSKSKAKRRRDEDEEDDDDLDEDEEEEAPKKSKVKSKKASAKKSKRKASVEDDAEDDDEDEF